MVAHSPMHVKKRDGRIENCEFDKVTTRLAKLTNGLSDVVDPQKVAQQVFSSIYDGITTHELDVLTSEIAVSMQTTHPDFEVLATRITASNIQKTAPKTFHDAMTALYEAEIVTEDVYQLSKKKEIEDAILADNDYKFTYFGLKTLEKGYLLRVDDVIAETPQYLWMRVALGIWGDNTEQVLKTYRGMSNLEFIHASPTLFNSGTRHSQLSSCFLVANKEDSIDGIFDTIKECAKISKYAGGIGLHVHDVRATGTRIKGTDGKSDGIVPMLRCYNNVARYVNQGGGKRKGSIAIYIEPWHADIESFLELRLNQGDDERRTRDLFTALWMNDLFFERLRDDKDWTLMCPNQCPGLADVHGDAFRELYERYETEGRGVKTISASTLWKMVCKSQIETGTPYMLYKDSCNKKSNHKHLGTIKSSNLCTEIVEFTDPEETAVCNLASIALPRFFKEDGTYDYDRLHETAKQLTKNLNQVIDVNFYPVESAKNSNMKHRPIGLGVQGLADVFMMMREPFDSPKAREVNRHIFECIYHGALEASCELAEIDGSYQSFDGSPTSEGVLQFDLWDEPTEHSGRYDWDAMRARVKKGLRNSLLLAPMPTASTSQILGNNECFEPYQQNIYLRRTLAGEFTVLNRHLVNDLLALGLWNTRMKDLLIRTAGSVEPIKEIPDELKNIYRTVWEISQKSVIDMAADRAKYICQSQSMNLFLQSPTVAQVSSMHFYSWQKGLKTGMYYLRSKPKSRAIQFSLEPECVACSA